MADAANVQTSWTTVAVAQGGPATTIEVAPLDAMSEWTHYSIRNGAVATVKPYLQKSTIPEVHNWVSLPGVRPSQALRSMDMFIKAHWWHIERTAGAGSTPEQRRKTGILLGVSRCIMLANYGLLGGDFVAGEVTQGPVNVTYNNASPPAITYTVNLGPNPEPNVAQHPAPPANTARAAMTAPWKAYYDEEDARAVLTGALALTEEEAGAFTAIVHGAQGTPPLQGFALMNDGHHYLGNPTKASFKAFQAVETQLWVEGYPKSYLDADKDFVRTILWHRAAHPISPHVKMTMATDVRVADNLKAAALGAASTRLPAVESELKPLLTYAKITEAVKTSIRMYNGTMDNRVLHEVIAALRAFPIGLTEDQTGPAIDLGPYVPGGPVVSVKTRDAVKAFGLGLIERSQEYIALCYGFYLRMIEAQGMAIGGDQGAGETLSRAFSLKKLRDQCPASFSMGYEMGADYKAFRGKMRNEGAWLPPKMTFA